MDVRFSFRETGRETGRERGGIRLHVAEAGPQDGPLVILLHGFPEFWFGWRAQIPALAEAGYRVIAPDQRGYNLSDKPSGIGAYDIDILARDILGLAQSYGAERFALIGHDWGALIAWWLAQHYPQRLSSVSILNVGHPTVWQEAIRHNPAQRKLSWYVAAFQIPWLPELALGARDFASPAAALRDSRSEISDEELALYRSAWSQSGALTAMVNWYRAARRRRFSPVAANSITPPVQILWGALDKYGVPALAQDSAKLCCDAKLIFLPDATHWVQHDAPQRVNALLLEHLSAHPTGP